MIPKECKRLAEVDFPIAVVSKHSAREKSIRHGHPSTLHLWWARRPLGACRAMLLGLLLPDPCDKHCPEDFKTKARELLPRVQSDPGPTDGDLRKALLRFIGDFANWDLATHTGCLAVSRGLVQAAHPEETPLVVDPFAGGGSIPLEALRLGCETFASDLNPVACLILKVMLEDIPRHGPELADELRRVGTEIKTAAEKELAEFYPPDPNGARPIAYLWARTVRCESPNCGAEIPLMRSFWLCKKANRRRALRPGVVRTVGRPPEAEFEIFEPENESVVRGGTVSRAKATCLCCGMVLPAERVRAQLREQRGGADAIFDEEGNRVGGARLTAVVTLDQSRAGRSYRLPTADDYRAVRDAMVRLAAVSGEPLPDGGSQVPDEPTPAGGGSGAGRAFSIQSYGMMQWGDLYSARQKLALSTFCRLTRSEGVPPSLAEPLALAVSHVASRNSSECVWRFQADQEKVEHVFGRQALPVIWDFAEACMTSDGTGSYSHAVDIVSGPIAKLTAIAGSGEDGDPFASTQLADACESPLPDDSCGVWFTDPPYYDAVPYAELSDYFLVWLKRTLPGHPLLRDPFTGGNPLSPKTQEIVQDEMKQFGGLPKDRAFFEARMGDAFAEGRRALADAGVGCVVFAHKTTEGWEALLSGLVGGGWTITGSWPIATEMANRLRARESAALATSVHLVCRPRPEDAHVGDWANVLRELPRRVGDWMERLQSEGVRGADLVFACIGPALEVYSRYSRVETAEGHEVPLGGNPEAQEPQHRGFLAYVWEVIGRSALEQVLGTAEAKARNGAAGALEEDARLTALFLWTLQSTASSDEGGSAAAAGPIDPDDEDEGDDEGSSGRRRTGGLSLIFDVVIRFTRPLGIHLDDWEGRIIETSKGVVRLLPVAERAKQLFGEDGAQVVAQRIETDATVAANPQMTLFPDEAPAVRGRRRTRAHGDPAVPDRIPQSAREATTLDRIHAAMLLQAGGRTNALRALL